MVYCTGLENRRTERFRGFESRSLRHSLGTKGLDGISGPKRGKVIILVINWHRCSGCSQAYICRGPSGLDLLRGLASKNGYFRAL